MGNPDIYHHTPWPGDPRALYAAKEAQVRDLNRFSGTEAELALDILKGITTQQPESGTDRPIEEEGEY